MTETIRNFGRNVDFRPQAIYRPGTANEVLEILTQHRGQEIRAIGTLHAWSPVAATNGVIIDMQLLDFVEIDREGQSAQVTVGGGCKLKHLVKQLAEQDLTLPSLGLIDEQSVAGATATGTHGSGKNSLSHFVESVSIAHYDAKTGLARISVVDSGPELQAARCSLGLMGIIISLRFRCRPRYNIEEHARSHPTLDSVLAGEE
jgi:FAD/FMN-containing dehydrogenase